MAPRRTPSGNGMRVIAVAAAALVGMSSSYALDPAKAGHYVPVVSGPVVPGPVVSGFSRTVGRQGTARQDDGVRMIAVDGEAAQYWTRWRGPSGQGLASAD